MRMYRNGTTGNTRGERGGGTVNSYGYRVMTNNGAKTFEHVIIVENAIGIKLPEGAEIHHIDGDKLNNSLDNLIVCFTKKAHKQIHTRERAASACGNPSHRKCPLCKEYDDIDLMSYNKHSRYFYHPQCRTKYNRSRGY